MTAVTFAVQDAPCGNYWLRYNIYIVRAAVPWASARAGWRVSRGKQLRRNASLVVACRAM